MVPCVTTANWRDSVRVRMHFRVGREVAREREWQSRERIGEELSRSPSWEEKKWRLRHQSLTNNLLVTNDESRCSTSYARRL